MPACLGLKLCCGLLQHSQSKLPEIRQAWIKARLCSEVWCSGDVCELDLFKEQEQTKEVSLQLHFYSLSHWRKKKKLLLDIKQPASWHCPRDTDPPVSTRSCLGFAKRGCEQGDGAVQGAVPACRARGCTRPPHTSQPQCGNQNCSWETGSVAPSARLLPLSKGIKLFPCHDVWEVEGEWVEELLGGISLLEMRSVQMLDCTRDGPTTCDFPSCNGCSPLEILQLQKSHRHCIVTPAFRKRSTFQSKSLARVCRNQACVGKAYCSLVFLGNQKSKAKLSPIAAIRGEQWKCYLCLIP